MKFSERYGYVKPVDVLKRGGLDKGDELAFCNCFDHLAMWLNQDDVKRGKGYDESYTQLEETIWCFFMNQRRDDFYSGRSHIVVATEYLLSNKYEWYKKFDLIEFSIDKLRWFARDNDDYIFDIELFIKMLNSTFKRLNYAYRIVDDQIVEITSEEEITSIEQAINASANNVKLHLHTALSHLAEKPNADYRNSIKESISAVEAVCRELTDKNTLGEALNELEKAGVVIPKVMKTGFEKLYGYTNNKETGIRHSLMDDEGTYLPSSAEAVFMIVSCSAFINYLYAKRAE